MRRNPWATIVLLTLATACGGPDGTEARGGQPADPTTATTTATPATAATATPVPSDSPVGPNPWFDGIWPDSLAALDEAKAALDQGHEPWRTDPVATARAYLLDLGIEEPTVGEFTAGGGGYGRVRFEAGVISGYVHLRQLDLRQTDPAAPAYVVRLSSSRAEVVQTEREGDTLRVRVVSLAPGTVVVRAGAFGSEWQDEERATGEVGAPLDFTLDVEGSPQPVLVEVRHEGSDGAAGLTRLRVQPSESSSASTTPAAGRLSDTSTLRLDGLGPIDVGMTHDQALAAAGGPMIVVGTEHCGMLRASGTPEFVNFVAPAGFDGRIAVISVYGDVVHTVEGIRNTSTEAEVLAAYPGIERLGDGDAHRLVHRLPGSVNAGDPVLSFVIVNSRVVAMEAGVGALVLSEEYCA